MKFYLLILLNVILGYTSGQRSRCYSCNYYASSSSITSRKCLTNATTGYSSSCRSGYYCLTSIYYSNGVLSSLRRKCQSPYGDFDTGSSRVPGGMACQSSYSTYSTVPGVTCYYPCTGSLCNTITPKLPGTTSTSPSSTPSTCPAECPDECDSFGQCKQSSLRCIQCNSDVDPNCATKTLAVPCKRTSHTYCSISKVTTLDANQGTFIRTTVTKSCTSVSSTTPHQGKCGLSVTSSSFDQKVNVNYACAYYCNTHGCNVDTPERGPTKNNLGMSCVVCSQKGSRSSSCSTKTSLTRCPASTRYCKTTVQYFLAKNSVNQGVAQSKIAYITRECATKPVKTNCTSFTLQGSDLVGVTCQETCQTHGCNTGWPGRPKCSQCNSKTNSYNQNSFSQCLKNPPTPKACPSPAQMYCRKVIENMDFVEGYNSDVIRECAYANNGTKCTKVNVGGTVLRNCQTTCNTDGCNLGTTSGHPLLKPSLIVVFALAIFTMKESFMTFYIAL